MAIKKLAGMTPKTVSFNLSCLILIIAQKRNTKQSTKDLASDYVQPKGTLIHEAFFRIKSNKTWEPLNVQHLENNNPRSQSGAIV
jgi:hypothetical protein